MTLPLPRLDDLTYDDLVAEAVARIPHLYPQWTDHNPGDPGIALVELLAGLSEMVLYRIDQTPPETFEAFLRLLNEPGWTPPPTGLPAATRATVLALRERYRAVTADDYEYLVQQQWPASPEATKLGLSAAIGRVRCFPQRNLEAGDPGKPAPSHMSLVVVPAKDAETTPSWSQPAPQLLQALWQFLDQRRLLAIRHHVVGPTMVRVSLAATLTLEEDAQPQPVRSDAAQRITRYFDPLTGGANGQGWPFGRAVYLSELYALLDGVPGVDHVVINNLMRGGEPVPNGQNIVLAGHELVDFEIDADRDFTIKHPGDNA